MERTEKAKKDPADHKILLRAYRKVIVLLLTAILLSALLLTVANDMYAFVKKSGEVTLYLDGTQSIDQLADLLAEHEIVLHPHLFALYVRYKHKEERLLSHTGALHLDRAMSYREILLAFS